MCVLFEKTRGNCFYIRQDLFLSTRTKRHNDRLIVVTLGHYVVIQDTGKHDHHFLVMVND